MSEVNPPTTTTLDHMTQARWNSLTERERAQLRSDAGLSTQLRPWEGWRVEVVDDPGDKPRRFIVGKSTGWRPCHLEISRRSAYGGCSARSHYASVRPLYKVR